MDYQDTVGYAQQMDGRDPLRGFREKFFMPRHNQRDAVYFTGNSLGLQPKTVRDRINQELEDWASLGVLGHEKARNPWLAYHESFAAPIAMLTGAQPHEVVVMNQLTVNLHLLLTSFYRPAGRRNKILCEAKAFPSDQYALASQVQLHGLDPEEVLIEIAPEPGAHTLRTEDIVSAIHAHGSSLALVMMGGVNYYSGQVLGMQAITAAAHQAGAYAGFDLAHAIGNIHLRLHEWQVDFACWCSYKYLNSGPGGVAGAYIHERHARNISLPRLAGWWGTNKQQRFRMEKDFDPIPTAEGWQLSNAPVLSMAAHKASLEIFQAAGMDALVKKSQALTGYLFYLLEEINRGQQHTAVDVITPADHHGCQVSMLLPERGPEVFEALMQSGVMADWREPNVIRVAPVPLYNTFEEVWQFGSIIKTILERS